ncbi:hypothetical protein ABBQ32_012015 [Trebouxia sp. C0010 RCD-2024]
MESHAPAMELNEGVLVPDLTLPPNIDEYVPLQNYAAPGNTQLDRGVDSMTDRQNAEALPVHSTAQSASNTFLEEGQNTALCVSQLVQLLQQSSNSTESLARLPLIEYLKQQADRLSSSADPCTTAIWQLTDHAAVEQAMQQCIEDPSFGREQDALCGWLYEWYRRDDPILQRFVARFAPALMKRYMFHCLSTQQTEPVPGLEACLVAIYEVKSSLADCFRLPDLSQPSVHHNPTVTHRGKPGTHQSPARKSSVPTVLPSHSIPPAGVAALFGSPATLGQAKALSGIRSWQRDAVVGAALRSFCSWMVTYTDAAIAAFASLALSLAAAGCPWIQAEAQRLLQEELTLGQQAQTTHTQPLSQTYRVQLSPEILDPLCHGLGHAIYRLALALQPSMQPSLSSLPAVAASPRGVLEGPQLSSLQSTLGLIAEAVAALHVRTTYSLASEGVLLTQSLLPQVCQLYHQLQAASSASVLHS